MINKKQTSKRAQTTRRQVSCRTILSVGPVSHSTRLPLQLLEFRVLFERLCSFLLVLHFAISARQQKVRTRVLRLQNARFAQGLNRFLRLPDFEQRFSQGKLRIGILRVETERMTKLLDSRLRFAGVQQGAPETVINFRIVRI